MIASHVSHQANAADDRLLASFLEAIPCLAHRGNLDR
jgi:hypothetical protein